MVRNYLFVTLFPLAAFLTVGPASAQEEERPNAVEAFLERKATERRSDEEVFDRRGRSADLRGLRGMVQAISPPRRGASVPITDAQAPLLDEAYRDEIARFLLESGFTPGDIRARSGRGDELILAAADALVGRASFAQQALLSQVVVIGEVTAKEDGPFGDFGSRLVFRVVNPLIGREVTGQEVHVLQESGPTGNGQYRVVSTDLTPAVGDQLLLFLSRARLEHRAARRGRGSSPDGYVTAFAAYVVDGALLRATVPGADPVEADLASTLEQITATSDIRGRR